MVKKYLNLASIVLSVAHSNAMTQDNAEEAQTNQTNSIQSIDELTQLLFEGYDIPDLSMDNNGVINRIENKTDYEKAIDFKCKIVEEQYDLSKRLSEICDILLNLGNEKYNLIIKTSLTNEESIKKENIKIETDQLMHEYHILNKELNYINIKIDEYKKMRQQIYDNVNIHTTYTIVLDKYIQDLAKDIYKFMENKKIKHEEIVRLNSIIKSLDGK